VRRSRPAAWYTKGVTLDEPRSPRDAQRRRLYLAETPLPTSPLPGLDACAAYADRVVGTLWWEARFPDRGLGRVPGFRPGHGARQAFFTTDERGTTITLPRRYRTKGVVLHELVHWALADDIDLPTHGRTFARLLLDATQEFLGCERAEALQTSYREQRVHVARPPRLGPDCRLHYGWDERLRLGKGKTLAVLYTARDGGPIATTGVYEGYERGASTLRVRVGGAARPMRISAATVWDVRPMPEARPSS
jgi:putative metallohydrolase (TIGR04338 family)